MSSPENGSLALVQGAVSTVVLRRGEKKVVSWDPTWSQLAAAGFITVLEHTPPPVLAAPEPAKTRSRKKTAPVKAPKRTNKLMDEAAEAALEDHDTPEE